MLGVKLQPSLPRLVLIDTTVRAGVGIIQRLELDGLRDGQTDKDALSGTVHDVPSRGVLFRLGHVL